MLENIMKLLEAGFTADEIRQMTAAAAPEKPAADPEPPDPEPEKPAVDPEPAKPAGPDPVLAAIEKLTGSFNAFMTRSSGLEKLPSDDPQQTAEEILNQVLKGVKPKA